MHVELDDLGNPKIPEVLARAFHDIRRRLLPRFFARSNQLNDFVYAIRHISLLSPKLIIPGRRLGFEREPDRRQAMVAGAELHEQRLEELRFVEFHHVEDRRDIPAKGHREQPGVHRRNRPRDILMVRAGAARLDRPFAPGLAQAIGDGRIQQNQSPLYLLLFNQCHILFNSDVGAYLDTPSPSFVAWKKSQQFEQQSSGNHLNVVNIYPSKTSRKATGFMCACLAP